MYKFPLGAVLNHRKFLEENLQKELGQLKKVLVDERKKLGDIKRAKKGFSRELQNKQKKSSTISETLLYVRFIDQLSKRVDMQKERITEAENDVERKREDLVGAMKNRKVIEKLKEKGWETFKHNMLRKEQNFMNEMAAIRFKPKSQE